MSVNTSKRGSTVSALVTIKNSSGAIVSGATVKGSWSGLISGTSTVTTNRNGQATFSTPRLLGPGTEVFTVTGVTANGYSYDEALNVETTDSILLN